MNGATGSHPRRISGTRKSCRGGLGDHYYLYEVERRRAPGQKGSKKVTGKYVGKITREGVVSPKQERRACGGALDAGNIRFLEPFARVLEPVLAQQFPHDWQSLLAAATSAYP